jgi:hypothetical protein
MMARRAHGAEDLLDQPRHDGVHRSQDASCGEIGGGQRPRRHRRVGIERNTPAGRRMVVERRDIAGRMDLRDPLVFGFPRFDPGKPGQGSRLLQLLHDGAQPMRRLGMSGSHVVLEVGRMVDQTCFTHSRPREA